MLPASLRTSGKRLASAMRLEASSTFLHLPSEEVVTEFGLKDGDTGKYRLEIVAFDVGER